MKPQPPKWADRFLEWYCNPDLLEDLQGDLHEIFAEKIATGKARSARFYFVWCVLRSFRFSVINRDSKLKNTTLMMTKNNFKIAFRVLWNDKFNTLLSLAGLAIGITCFILMGFYVKQELSYDQFNTKKDRIYRVWLKEVYGPDQIFFNSVTPIIFEKTLEDNFGEIETVVQFDKINYLVGQGNDRYNENVGVISPEFFNVFDFPLIKGNTETPLQDRNNIVLSESYAQKYFGLRDPIGQALPVQIGEEVREFIVSAVYADIPKESSVRFDMAISNENNKDIYGERAMTAWFNVSPETYVLIKDNANINSVEAGIPAVVMSNLKERVNPGEYNIGFQPLTDIHLNTEIPVGKAPVGNPTYVYILAIISVLVLVTAGVNYTTLSIGQSLKRSKEVGVRKVMGAMRTSLVNQYLSESLLISFFAVLVGIALAHVALPIFNDLTGADVSLSFEPWHMLLYIGLILLIGLASGIYPALVLSRLRVISILQGKRQSNSKHYIRKGMVVFQFVITVFLICSTLIMRKQLNYIQTKDLGINYNTTVSVPLYPDPAANRLSTAISSAMEKGNLLKEKLNQYGSISDIGMGSHVFGTDGWASLAYTDDEGNFRRFRLLDVDPYYMNTFNIKIKSGRSFDPESGLDKRQSIILNQEAVDYFGIKDPIGKRLPGKGFGDHVIIGVTDNFNYSSLHNAVEPLVITQNVVPIFQGISDNGFGDSPIPKLVFRYSGAQLTQVKNILEKEWKNTFPGEELNFSFVEDNMKAQYASENRMSKLVTVSTILSIIIASLGLLGLIVLVINSRIKEIGIRKVVGASGLTIFRLLASSFAMQLLLGILLSIPITYWLMSGWLNDFAYRIDIGIDTFVLGSLIALVLAFIAIGYHTVKAAMVNPVDSIRTE
ncbi:MAG TPA: ABC transporter permease [Fulvivirga sp.]|nr:ABC transporter permease [Fulvivirga sp.]